MSSLSEASPRAASAARWIVGRKRLFVLAAAALVVLIALVAFVSVRSQAEAETASAAYKAQVDQLQASLKDARGKGYTSADLKPITDRLQKVQSSSEPLWVGSRPGFYAEQRATVSQLRGSLRGLLVQVLGDARADATAQLRQVRDSIGKAQSQGLDSISQSTLQARLNTLLAADQGAKALTQYRNVAGQARQLQADVAEMVKTQKQEDAAVQAAAQTLLAQNAGNIDALRQIAQNGITASRNDASIAGYMNYGQSFKGDYNALSMASARLERWAAMVGSPDVNVVAQVAAATQRYGGQIHSALYGSLPPKFIVVSFAAQHVWAFQNGQSVMDSAVTTGVRGVTDYGTDFGPMKVLYKAHPWTMHSPYPKGSPYWYPDTPVQWTVWFTMGESFHDASWEPDSMLGPGSQYDASTRSHGCIHLPLNLANWMFTWADEGTPVIVYPGDGAPPTQQLSQITTDPQGHPGNPA